MTSRAAPPSRPPRPAPGIPVSKDRTPQGEPDRERPWNSRLPYGLSPIPCATCGAMPVGLMFHTAEQLARLGPDWFRRYDCSHPPIWPKK